MITGLSGAGRSQVGNILEDLGWFVIDNLPPSLIPKVAELADVPGSEITKVALVVGTGPYHEDVLPALEELRTRAKRLRIVFLEATTDVLVRRYESTRRRHPLDTAGHSLVGSIEIERELFEAVRTEADLVIDTSELNIHQLRSRVLGLFELDSPDSGMQTSIVSFGYKYGLPLDTDLVIDCRFLPNPYWVEGLRELTGFDDAVREYLIAQPATKKFLDRLCDLLDVLLPAYVTEGKSYLTLAFGCTGGRHRSVVVAREVANGLIERGYHLNVSHRDIER